MDADDLRATVGSLADWLRQLANGIDERKVEPNRESKSSGSENTYPQDLTDPTVIREETAAMAADAVAWLIRKSSIADDSSKRYSTLRHNAKPHGGAEREKRVGAEAVQCGPDEAGRRPVRLWRSVQNSACVEGGPEPGWLPSVVRFRLKATFYATLRIS